MLFAPLLAAWFAAATPAVGTVAPDFTATDTDGKVHHLDEMVQHGPVVVAFIVKAFTGG